jgi:hypothetical protein
MFNRCVTIDERTAFAMRSLSSGDADGARTLVGRKDEKAERSRERETHTPGRNRSSFLLFLRLPVTNPSLGLRLFVPASDRRAEPICHTRFDFDSHRYSLMVTEKEPTSDLRRVETRPLTLAGAPNPSQAGAGEPSVV